MSAQLTKPTLRLPRFKYTGDSKVLTSIDVDMDAELLIVGQPENGAYEWVIVNHGKIESHSDCGYGMSSIALRDGLIAFHGVPNEIAAAPALAQLLRDSEVVLNRAAADILADVESGWVPRGGTTANTASRIRAKLEAQAAAIRAALAKAGL